MLAGLRQQAGKIRTVSEFSRKGPWLGLLVGVAAVSSAAVLIKLCQVPALSIAAYRLAISAPMFWLLCWPRGAPWKGLNRSELGLIMASGCCLGLHFATWIASLSFTSVASSVVLVTLNPVFVGLGTVFFLREPVPGRLWVGTAMAAGGSVLIAFSDRGEGGANPLLGDGLALFGAVCMSAYMLLGRSLRDRLDTLAYVSLVYGAAAVVLLAACWVSGSPMGGFRQTDWLLLLALAAIPQALGHTMINWSLRALGATVVAVAILGEPIGASLLAYRFLGEPITIMQLVGAGLILVGVGLAARTALPPPQKGAEPAAGNISA
ncbi:MAG: DMT family transporter [Candidatus Eremiobacteraeota bacterium]|nr:DMT family transporter [Candidatus Eremiobacteraeota bacterium]